MPRVLGIDLGTTNSVMAIMEAGEPILLENAEGGRLTPSVVAVNAKTGERFVGQIAKRQAVTNPENTIFSIKRFMGRKFDDAEVQRALKRIPYRVTPAANGDVQIWMGGKAYSPPEISAMILAKMKTDAEAKLGEKIADAVITVPAYFNDSQRTATKDAGTIAGLNVLRIINEPTAASLAYGLGKGKEETMAVYDLGGGTFDVSVLRMGEGVFEVLSTAGDTFLGGDDFDARIIDWVSDEFKRDQGIDLRHDRMAMQRLKEAAERAKVELSSVMQTEISLPFMTADATGPKHLAMTLTRAKLESLVGDLIERTVGPSQRALQDANLPTGQVSEVVLVGGQTRMPAVDERVKGLFGKEPHRGVNPDEVVAIGAAIQAGVLRGEIKDVLLLDVTPLTLGLETLGGMMTALIPRNTTVPTVKSENFTTAADGQTSVEIHVLQGERALAAENKSLGRFTLGGLPAAPRGAPQIQVSFDIDANGILNVSARDSAAGKSQQVTITASSGLSKEDVDRAVREAEAHAEDDRRRREEIEVRNHADTLAYSAEKTLREHRERVPADVRSEVEGKIAALRSALQSGAIDQIRSVSNDLSEALQRFGTAVYSQQGAAAGQQGGGAPTGGWPRPPEGTVEGEFREV